MKDLIERLRNDTLDDISDTALEAADALERLTAGDIEMPAPCHHEMDGKICVGYFSEAQLKDYGDLRAAAAVLAEPVIQTIASRNAEVVRSFDQHAMKDRR